MNWKMYRVTYVSKIEGYHFDAMFNSYRCEALNSKDAVRMAKAKYKAEQARGIRNLPIIKNVGFYAVKVGY
jgi:hypothetical protein